MRFIIVGEKKDEKGKVVALFDVANGGVALATPYTIKQLLEMGHEVVGVDSTKPFRYHVCNRSGDPAKHKESLNVGGH